MMGLSAWNRRLLLEVDVVEVVCQAFLQDPKSLLLCLSTAVFPHHVQLV